jgi:peptidoglycan/xylan/chitin deacetylase (PgdA/CDA1 family)
MKSNHLNLLMVRLRVWAAWVFALFRLDDILNRIIEIFLLKKEAQSSGQIRIMRTKRWPGRFQVLNYHKISPEQHPFFHALDPGIFESHLKLLTQSYRVFDLEELVERARLNDIPERAVAITFDDGYRDNYEYAFPLLRGYGLPATIFLSTGSIDNISVLWHERIFDAFRFATVTSTSLRSWNGRRLELRDQKDAVASLEQVLQRARQLSTKSRLELIQDLEQCLCPDLQRNSRILMLSWNEILEMQTAGIRFGSHTVNHPILSRLPPQEAYKEISDSKRIIEARTRAPVYAFAYPNGLPEDYNETIKTLLKDSGYKCAVTTIEGYNTSSQDLFELRRVWPWDDNISRFRLQFFLQRYMLEAKCS